MAPKPFPSQAAATSDASVPRVLGCSPRLPAQCHRCHHGPCCHLPGTQRPARGAERLGSPGSPRPQKLVWQKGFATSCGEGQEPPAAPACSFDVPALMPRSSITKCGLKMCPSRRVAERTAAPQSCPRPLRREGGTAGWHRLGTWWPRVAARAPGTACWGLRAAFACCQLHVCPGAAEGSPRLPPAPEQQTALPKEHPPRCVPRGLLQPPGDTERGQLGMAAAAAAVPGACSQIQALAPEGTDRCGRARRERGCSNTEVLRAQGWP